MRSDRITSQDKQILALDRELDKLYRIQRKAPLIPLEKPYQAGWCKRFQLRDDITRRRDASALKVVLGLVNTTIYGRDRTFTCRDGKPKQHSLRILPVKMVEGLKLNQACMKWLTKGHWHDPYYGLWRLTEGYAFNAPHHFLTEEIYPFMVTHTRTMYPDVEKRITEINNKIEKNNWWVRLNKIRGRRSGWRDIKLTRKRDFQNREIIVENEYEIN